MEVPGFRETGSEEIGFGEVASLMPGDIVVGIEGRALDSLEQFERALEYHGERVMRLHFVRGNRTNTRNVAVRLGVANMDAITAAVVPATVTDK